MTFKITVSQASPTPSGLRLGMRIEHEKAGWVRFSTCVILDDDLSEQELANIQRWVMRARSKKFDDLQGEFDWE